LNKFNNRFSIGEIDDFVTCLNRHD